MHRPAASRQYLHAPLIVEAAQHRAQDIDVTVRGNAHGRVTRDALDPSGNIISQTHALDHAGISNSTPRISGYLRSRHVRNAPPPPPMSTTVRAVEKS